MIPYITVQVVTATIKAINEKFDKLEAEVKSLRERIDTKDNPRTCPSCLYFSHDMSEKPCRFCGDTEDRPNWTPNRPSERPCSKCLYELTNFVSEPCRSCIDTPNHDGWTKL